jgi:ionotropic glutamate receptor NMDA 1
MLVKIKGLFILVGGGIILGMFVIFLEIEYKKRKEKKMKRHDLSRNAFATWRKNVEVIFV